MILSRLTKAVREQNWFAVALEFVIVISGVAIGFQITAWNETRQDEAREALVLERLQTDFEVIHADTETALTDLEQRAGYAAAFVDVITDDSITSASPEFRNALALSSDAGDVADFLDTARLQRNRNEAAHDRSLRVLGNPAAPGPLGIGEPAPHLVFGAEGRTR